MRIGITGDTHGDFAAIRRVLHVSPPVDCWLHTGDFSQDALFLAKESGLSVQAVAGNTDSYVGRSEYERTLELAGRRLWLTHGHRYLAGGKGVLLDKARELGASIVVYGHTHVPEGQWYDDVLLINPGSPARPRGGSKAGFAVLILGEGKLPVVERVLL